MLVPHGRHHEVDTGNPKGKNIPGDPSLRVFGGSVAWFLQLSFPLGLYAPGSPEFNHSMGFPAPFSESQLSLAFLRVLCSEPIL